MRLDDALLLLLFGSGVIDIALTCRINNSRRLRAYSGEKGRYIPHRGARAVHTVCSRAREIPADREERCLYRWIDLKMVQLDERFAQTPDQSRLLTCQG